MRAIRQLSRLAITGHIHEHTPLCVLMEIADAHGIKYNPDDCTKPNFNTQLISRIHETNIPTISGNNDRIEWQYIARFVNKNCDWPQSKLLQAYNFLVKFTTNQDPLENISKGFICGLQTPDNVTAVNACILYKICTLNRLNVNMRTTMKQMAYCVNMLREDVESLNRRVNSYIEKHAKRSDLINILMLSPYEIQDPEPKPCESQINYSLIPKPNTTFDVLQTLHSHLHDVKILQHKIEPGTDYGAIALAAINYGIDISKARDPIREYKILKISGRNDYKPGDLWMAYWYKINPNLFDIYETFNPLFPSKYYDSNRLKHMAFNEGFTSNEINLNDPYELLSMNYLTDTFYMGEFPNIKSRTTLIDLDSIDEIPYGQLICFGSYELPLHPVSLSELVNLFNANRNFTNPFQKNSVFSSTAIGKLKSICQNPSGPNHNIRLPESTIKIRTELLEIIISIELHMKTTDEPTRNFINIYRESSSETRLRIKTVLTNLLHVGMYMRGWTGSGVYPVIKAPVPPEREPEVAVNVTNALAAYESSYKSLGKIGSQINNLPLVRYRDGEYQLSNYEHDGKTIGQRINIIKEGDTTNNVASCIRLSSNWLCASAHKYITCLGLPPPFDIFNLRDIS